MVVAAGSVVRVVPPKRDGRRGSIVAWAPFARRLLASQPSCGVGHGLVVGPVAFLTLPTHRLRSTSARLLHDHVRALRRRAAAARRPRAGPGRPPAAQHLRHRRPAHRQPPRRSLLLALARLQQRGSADVR